MATETLMKESESLPILTATGTLSTQEYIEYEDKYAAAGLKSLPLVITRAQGSNLWDHDGNKYIDFLSSFSVVNQGHCHPRITQTMIEQCQKCTLVSRAYHNEHYPLVCKTLCELLNMDLAFAMNSGSEAVDLTIKVTRKWGYNVKGIAGNEALILTCSENYHGKTLGPLSASSNTKIRNGFGPYLPGVGPFCAGKLIRFNHLGHLEDVLKEQGHRVAAFMVECVQGYAGCLPADLGYIKGAFDLCKKHNVLFIADEIQTGFGRTGSLMAYQRENIQPDMVILGKALTGGVYTMSMVLGCREAMGQLQYGEHSSTFSGNPLASAVALIAIDVVVEEKLPERSAHLGKLLKERLGNIKSQYTKVSVTGQWLFCAFHIDESHKSGRITAARLTSLMRKRGVLAYSVSNRVRIAPPLNISKEDLWSGVDIIERSLNDLIDISEQLL